METLAAYGGLFLACLLEATVVPVRSEAVLLGLLYAGHSDVLGLIAVASLGNTLGATINWWLGRFIAHFEDRRWFPVRRDKVRKAELWYERYGRWALLLSWLPVIGDVITIAAGVLRERLLPYLAIVGFVKTVRYLVVVALALQWL